LAQRPWPHRLRAFTGSVSPSPAAAPSTGTPGAAAPRSSAGRLYFEVHRLRKAPTVGVIAQIIRLWKASPEFGLHSERTQKDLARLLKIVEAEIGDMPLRALEAKGARKALIEWRNEHRDKPRTADSLASALSQCLRWARDQGHVSADPMAKWPWIYKVDRSHIVWTADEIAAVCGQAGPDLQRAILFAAYSGIRQGDLLRLPWSAIAPGEIIRRTGKRGRVVRIPIKPALQAVIDACPKVHDRILTREGEAWIPSTLHKQWGLAREAAIEACPSIEGKRWHDLRGTFATLLIRGGAADEDVDRIMGWKPGQSEQTRASYVTGDVVAEATLRRLQKADEPA
jgi:integrase